MKLANLAPVADSINRGDIPAAIRQITRLLRAMPTASARGPVKPEKPAWHTHLARLAAILRGGDPRYTIIAKGNSKLGNKFLAFSTLPATAPGGAGCPGAGDCVTFCYSRKAWRYPAAFCRQAQNSYLMQTSAGRQAIAADLARKAPGYKIFRLYVDGDFTSRPPVDGRGDFAFWMDQLRTHYSLNGYGYTKSFTQVIAYKGAIPNNYLLNVSSGHNHSPATVAAVKRRQVSRGDFIAVDYAPVHSMAQHGDRAHRARLVKAHRAATGRKAFACPGACNTCTPNHGHACGSERFRGLDIIIAAH